jgi:CheY-like chemotaxis protein
MARLLIVEDETKDIRTAVTVALSVGISSIEARTSLRSATAYLEKGLQGELPLPDRIILDLDLGGDSGYELLRLWHMSPQLCKIPVIIWSNLGENNRDVCSLFKVNDVVFKWQGPQRLREALANVESASESFARESELSYPRPSTGF